MAVNINGLTFNVAGEKAPPNIGDILIRNKNPDIFIISLQEVDLGKKIIVNFRIPESSLKRFFLFSHYYIYKNYFTYFHFKLI